MTYEPDCANLYFYWFKTLWMTPNLVLSINTRYIVGEKSQIKCGCSWFPVYRPAVCTGHQHYLYSMWENCHSSGSSWLPVYRPAVCTGHQYWTKYSPSQTSASSVCLAPLSENHTCKDNNFWIICQTEQNMTRWLKQ